MNLEVAGLCRAAIDDLHDRQRGRCRVHWSGVYATPEQQRERDQRGYSNCSDSM